MRWLVAVLAIAGCDRFLNLDQVHLQPDGPACTMPPLTDDFSDAAAPCSTWGTLDDTHHILTRTNGRLVITPMDAIVEYGQCQSMFRYSLGDEGVFVQIAQAPAAHSYGGLQLKSYGTVTDPAATATTALTFSTGGLSFFDPGTSETFGTAVYVADQMNWMRIVPRGNGAQLVGQYSPDGYSWIDFGTRDLGGLSANFVRVIVGGGNTASVTTGTPTAFESLGICPSQ